MYKLIILFIVFSISCSENPTVVSSDDSVLVKMNQKNDLKSVNNQNQVLINSISVDTLAWQSSNGTTKYEAYFNGQYCIGGFAEGNYYWEIVGGAKINNVFTTTHLLDNPNKYNSYHWEFTDSTVSRKLAITSEGQVVTNVVTFIRTK